MAIDTIETTSEDETAATGGSEGRTTPTQAIRLHCLECCCGSWREVELCQVPRCALWPWRFGSRPETARAQGKLVEPAKFVPAPFVRGTKPPKRGLPAPKPQA